MNTPREEDINNEILIKEIEMRPALYNRMLKEYTDINLKKRLWEEICKNLFPNCWDKFSQIYREKIVNEVQKRWKNLRACFSRELRLQKHWKSSHTAHKRRKYVYYKDLLFLKSSIEQHESFDADDNIDNMNCGENDFNYQEDATFTNNSQSTYEIKYEPCEEPSEEVLNKERQDSSFSQRSSPEEEEKENEENPDVHFVLSLVPSLKKLSYEKKIEAKIQILNILKTAYQTSVHSHSQDSSTKYNNSSLTVNQDSGLLGSSSILPSFSVQTQNYEEEPHNQNNSVDRQQFNHLCQMLRTITDMINNYASRM